MTLLSHEIEPDNRLPPWKIWIEGVKKWIKQLIHKKKK